MTAEKLYELTATEIVSLIGDSQITAVEVASSFIERMQSIYPQLRVWDAIDEAYITDQAEQINASGKCGLLTGVPIGVKDVFNTKFYPTQKGSPIWKGYKSGNDARCVSYLRDEGGIIFGKTSTAELAVHANVTTRNPYNLSHTTGSSSGGSAAAVSTAMVPVALGTQTGGSIIRPASWCGVYGMKPSFGLIPRTGVLKTTDTLDSIGFFGRSVSDLGLLLDTLRIRGDNFPIQEREIKKHRDTKRDKWRIAFCETPVWGRTESYVKDAIMQLKTELEKLKEVEIVNVALPQSTANYRDLHRRIYHPCLAYYLKNEFNKDPNALSDTLKAIFEDAKKIPPEDYGRALREQEFLAEEMEGFFVKNRIDAILTNSSNGSAPYAKEPDVHEDLNPLWTMAWLPTISIPQFTCENGLPYGFQMVGPRFGDYKLLSLLQHLDANALIPSRSKIVTPSFVDAYA